MTAADSAEPLVPSGLEAAPDDVLVDRSIDGDTAAFAILLRRHAPLLRAYTARIVGSIADADDVVQETFVIAWRRLPTLRDRSHVKAWLLRIVTRRAFRYLKRRPPTVDFPDPWSTRDSDDPESAAIRTAQLDAVSAALQQLPIDQRQCWLLREIGELSYQEIADQMGITLAQTRGRLARARASMAVQMEEWR